MKCSSLKTHAILPDLGNDHKYKTGGPRKTAGVKNLLLMVKFIARYNQEASYYIGLLVIPMPKVVILHATTPQNCLSQTTLVTSFSKALHINRIDIDSHVPSLT